MKANVHTSQTGYRPLVYMVARTVALPHGYTLLIWATTMVMVNQHGIPDIAAVFCMLAGACGAYVVAGGLGIASRVHVVNPASHQPRIVQQPYLVATANFATLAAATGLCTIAAFVIPITLLAWLAVGLIGTSVYLVGIAFQNQFIEHVLLENSATDTQTIDSHADIE